MKNANSRRLGFTLIELLVVVLIIGILAAVALPQYQKAVEKSRVTQALAMLKSVAAATTSYHLATGNFATSFDELDMDIPWSGHTKFRTETQDTRSNELWSLELLRTTDEGSAKSVGLSIGHIFGPYKGTGFVYYNSFVYPQYTNQIFCVEYYNSVYTAYTGEKGSYCSKIVGATYSHNPGHAYYFTMP